MYFHFRLNHWFKEKVDNIQSILISFLWWKFKGLTWKRIRSVLEISILFSACTGVRILWAHLADSLSNPKISTKTLWPKPELMLMDLTISLTGRHLSSKTVQWMASNCFSAVEVFGQTEQRAPSVPFLPGLNLPRTFSQLNLKKKQSSASIFIVFTCIFTYVSLADTVMTARVIVLSIFRFVADLCSVSPAEKSRLNNFFEINKKWYWVTKLKIFRNALFLGEV